MGNALKEPSAPIYNDEGLIDFKKLKEVLGLTYPEVAQLIDTTTAVVKAKKTSSSADTKAKRIKYICELLAPLVDKDPVRMKKWFRGPKPYWYGMSPIESMLNDNFDAVIEELERIYHGEGPGNQ